MGDLVDLAEFDESVCQETERPAAPTRRRASTRQGDQVGLLLAVEHPRAARQGTTDEGTVETAFDEVASDPVDGDRREIQSAADLLVGPSRASVAAIGLRQDARPGQFAGRRLALGDHGLQLFALLDREAHNESLVHNRTPSQDLGQICQDWMEVRATYQYQVDRALVSRLSSVAGAAIPTTLPAPVGLIPSPIGVSRHHPPRLALVERRR